MFCGSLFKLVVFWTSVIIYPGYIVLLVMSPLRISRVVVDPSSNYRIGGDLQSIVHYLFPVQVRG